MGSTAQAITASLRQVLPPTVKFALLSDYSAASPLVGKENGIAQVFSSQRRLEFMAGRHCAREALTSLAIPAAEILVGPNREPLWPAGVTGSITHCETLCIAVVARIQDIAQLGLDIEVVRSMQRELWPVFCLPAEIDWLESLPSATQNLVAATLFSAKESFFKCQYPATYQRLSFHDLDLRLEQGAVMVRSAPVTGLTRYVGRYVHEVASGVVITSFWIEASPLMIAT